MVVIYRTSGYGSAWYRSVATSICTVIEVKNISEFESCDDFVEYCIKYSVFKEEELRLFWSNQKYPYLIRMIYNVALDKRPIRKQLVEDAGLDAEERWVALPLTNQQFLRILELGDINEDLIIY